MKQRQFAKIIFTALLFITTGCQFLESPGVKDKSRMIASFSHAGLTQSCTACHIANLPTGLVPTNAGAGATQFDHANIGSTDCVSCHMAVPANIGVRWSGGNLAHSASYTSCTTCHSSAQWPTSNGPFVDAIGATINSFIHATQGTGDCLGCHQKALQNMTQASPNMTWANTGSSYPTTLSAYTGVASGSTDYTASQVSTPIWGGSIGTTITSVSTTSVTLPQTMNHSSLQISPSQLQSCTTCHQDAGAGQYRPSYYHHNITIQPNTCAECHGSGNLYGSGVAINGMPSGLVGPSGASRSPASGEMDHFAKNWILNGSTWTHTAVAAFNQDCVVCHTDTGNSWSAANFHTSLASNGKPQPTSCLDCHANNRPSGAVPASPSTSTPTQFDHANALGDCVTCHAAPTVTNTSTPASTALWANGVFHKVGAAPQTSCLACHASQRPNSTTGFSGLNTNAPFDYVTHGNGKDCVSCHTPTTFTSMTGWSGGKYTHSTSGTTTCTGCHTIPTTAWYPNANTISFTHTAGVDCMGCHSQALTNVISQGNNPTNAAWIGTGQNGLPSGPVGNRSLTFTESTLFSSVTPLATLNQVTSISSTTATLILNMDHSSTSIPSARYSAGSLNCVDCHTQAGSGIYRNGLFHKNPLTNSLWPQQPTSCKDCHNSILPTGIVGTNLKYLNHAALFTNGQAITTAFPDCSSCHSQPGVTGAWSTSGAFHKNISGLTPKTCTACHYQDVQALMPTLVNHMLHSSSQVNQDCSTCHAQPTAAQTVAGGYPSATLWAGGKYHGKIATQPTSCNTCHSSERPSTTTSSAVDSTSATLQYMNHASSFASSDCATCHKAEVTGLAAGAAPTAWLKTVSFHTGVPSGVTTCKECHGSTNGLASTANTTPTGVTVSASTSVLGNSGVTITPNFNAPAVGTPLYVNFNHKDPEVTSRDCVSCHTVPAANAGASYAKWKSGALVFHNVVPTVATGKCVNCHYNLMPNSSYTGYNHVSNLITTTASGNIAIPNNAGSYIKQDCGACHGANTGKNWLGASAASPHTATFLATANCVSCHAASGGPTTYSPGVAVGMPSGAVNLTAAGRTVTFYHVSPNTVTRFGGTGTVTINGSYNASQTSCLYCHGAAAKAIEVPNGSTSIIKITPTGTGWAAGTMGPSTSIGYHRLGPTSFTYTSGTGITAASGGSYPTTCSACHEQRRPSANHSAGQDCGSCHQHQNPNNGW